LEHFLLRFPALNEKRKITLSKLKQTLIQSTGQGKWTENIVGNTTLLLQSIIDVTAVADELNVHQETFKEIEMISRNLCFDLHVQRTLMYRRIKLAGRRALMTLGMAKLVNSNFILPFKSICLLVY
jgi:hypothetical protein